MSLNSSLTLTTSGFATFFRSVYN